MTSLYTDMKMTNEFLNGEDFFQHMLQARKSWKGNFSHLE